jgi:prefoldin subunit 5
MSSSPSTRRERQQERDNEYIRNIQQQHEATIRSVDETKDNIHRSIEKSRRELPRYSQTVTDFQNETADASMEIADNFLESQKEVINSMQSAWVPMAERIGQVAHYWTTAGMTPFSPSEIAIFTPEPLEPWQKHM